MADANPSTQNSQDLSVGRSEQETTSKPSTASKISAAVSDLKEKVEEKAQSLKPESSNPDDGGAPTKKKEKKPKIKQPQPAAAAAPPLSPALIDLRVGEILRCIPHENADSLYVSTIDMGDPEGTDKTHQDEETGKTVRTVCSGLRGLIPIEEMQGRKVITVCNLKPVTMRGIKSAAMVLAASPKTSEQSGEEHGHSRHVELVSPPEMANAGEKVYFEGWPYGEGKGPEKQLNPKKKQWEAIQPGFYTTDDLKVAFDSYRCNDMEKGGGVGNGGRGDLIVASGGICTVKSIKDGVVR
ncbi:MAG: hypothetical protein Q9227_005206 [Pyrenula ochraceoflavens]